MPAGLDEDCLKRVHGDAVVGSMPRGVCIVVAVPVPLVPPVQPNGVPAIAQEPGHETLKTLHAHLWFGGVLYNLIWKI